MASLVEMGVELLHLIPTKVKVAAVPVIIGVAGITYVVFGGGGESKTTATTAETSKDKTSTPTLLARTRTPTAVKSATREPTRTSTVESRKSASVTFDGVTYTTTPSDQNAACSTNQVPKYLMTEQQLRQLGLSRSDVVFMKRGQGQNNQKLAWYCGTNGQRIFKSK